MPGSQLHLSVPERAVLVAPDAVARAAATVLPEREQRWLLRQPREVRRSFAEEVLGRGRGTPVAQERWMLLQSEVVRRSYVREVLDPQPQGPPAARDEGPPVTAIAAGATATLGVAAIVVWQLLS